MTILQIIETISKNENIPKEVVEKVYKMYWKFVKEYISSMPLDSDISEEEFHELRTSINIPSLGKFNCPYYKYKAIKNKIKNAKN